MVTLQQIADEAGVSRVVVSRVLNARPVRVGEATRRRILGLVERHGYQPNGLVKALRSKRTQALGVLLPSVEYSFFPRLLNGIEQAASARGWQVLMCQTHSRPEILANEVDMLRQRRVDGLLLTPHPESGVLLRRLLAAGQKLVFVDDTIAGLPVACAKSDDVAGVRQAVAHLLRLGRRRIAFVGWPAGVTPNSDARRQGYLAALAAQGLAADQNLVLDSPICGPREAGELIRGLLAGGIAFDAVFAVTDMAAIGALQALREAGLRTPQDVAVVGYGNLREGAYMSPALTTVDQQPDATGRRAVDLLLDAIEADCQPVPETLLAAPELIVRASCGAASEIG